MAEVNKASSYTGKGIENYQALDASNNSKLRNSVMQQMFKAFAQSHHQRNMKSIWAQGKGGSQA
ncbi:MAG: hypothetical protein WC529_01690 [Candidatus Margulisiibacteriota bacterium]